MARVTVHVTVRVRRTTVREEMHNLMNTLLVLTQVIPKHGRILKIRLGVPLLRMNKHGELARIADEEDGRVVEDPVMVALVGVELDGEATGIAGGIWGTLLAADGGEAGDAVCLFADSAEHVHAGEVGDIVGYFEGSVGAGSFGVDDTLGDTLAWSL